MTGVSESSRNGTGLVMAQAPRSAAAEAYRTLSTNIQFSSLDRDVRTLLVTSVGPDEGKSIVLANLAITMAEGGRRVVMVDCDLRRPSLHEIFGLADQPGLTTMMLNESLALPLQVTPFANVSLVAAGPLPPNPAELVGSNRMRESLEAAGSDFDMVLLDSPPVVSVSDAIALASFTDGVVLVVSSGKVPHDVVRRAAGQIEAVKGRILGVVINNVNLKRDGYYYDYYRYYQSYYAPAEKR